MAPKDKKVLLKAPIYIDFGICPALIVDNLVQCLCNFCNNYAQISKSGPIFTEMCDILYHVIKDKISNRFVYSYYFLS